ncbi:MAG: DUF3084 domain-containing protein [Abditibacteriota bacterium]|nr:DUF3084 domain-containing protein [Abditibacteriota bacterium]
MFLLSAIGLFILSGLIAYLGDLLGRRLGKKRLSVFGLRPKSTAIMITVLTGILISALAFALFFAMNRDFRRVFTEGEQILHENRKLMEDNDSLKNTNTELSAKSDKILADLRGTEKKFRDTKQQYDDAKQKFESAKKGEEAARISLRNAQQSVSSLRERIARRQADLTALMKDSKAKKSEIAAKEKELAEIKKEYTEAQSELRNAQLQLRMAAATVADTEALYEEKINELNTVTEELKQKEDALLAARETVDKMTFENAMQRNKNVPVVRGDELARISVPKGLSTFEILGKIQNLRNKAGEEALARGISPADGSDPVSVVYRQENPEMHYSTLYEDENVIINMAAAAIKAADRPVMVRAAAAVNTFADESVPIELLLNADDVVYPNGTLVGEQKIDTSLPDGRILIALIGFIQNTLPKIAEADGIIPEPEGGAFDINALPDSDKEFLLRQVEYVREMGAILKQEKKSGIVKVVARTNKDITVSHPLNISDLSFTVEPDTVKSNE